MSKRSFLVHHHGWGNFLLRNVKQGKFCVGFFELLFPISLEISSVSLYDFKTKTIKYTHVNKILNRLLNMISVQWQL